MKLLIMMLVVLLVAISSLAQKPVGRADEIVRELDGKLTAGLLQGDSASVDAILAADYMEINAQGQVRHKAEVMAIVRAVASVPRSISLGPEISVDEIKFRTYGDAVILTSLTTTGYQHMVNQESPQPVPAPSQTATYQERLLKVYSRLNGRWQLVASQATAIANR